MINKIKPSQSDVHSLNPQSSILNPFRDLKETERSFTHSFQHRTIMTAFLVSLTLFFPIFCFSSQSALSRTSEKNQVLESCQAKSSAMASELASQQLEQQKLISQNQRLVTDNQKLQQDNQRLFQQWAEQQNELTRSQQQAVNLQNVVTALKGSIPAELSPTYVLQRLSLDVQSRARQYQYQEWQESESLEVGLFLSLFAFVLLLIPLVDMGKSKGREKNQSSDSAHPMALPVKQDAASSGRSKVPTQKGGINFSYFAGEDVVASKLDLARAYIEMGDTEGARELANTILREGNESQKAEAGKLLSRLAVSGS